MQKKRSIKIIAIVLIIVLICLLITYSKNDSKVVLATTKEFNSESLQDNEHMHVETDNSGDKVPVPNGYVGSKATGENEIDTGYVIYEGTEEVNDSNVEEAQKTRNQYVWIPVPDVSKIYGTDANGKKWGKLYDFTTDIGDNIDSITGAKPFNWSENDGVMKISKTGYREPDIVTNQNTTGVDIDSNMKKLNFRIASTHEFLNQLEYEFNDMISSIQKYKGFYIGRYETGDLSKNEVVIKKENTDISTQTWYAMYKKCKELSHDNLNIQTSLIWGNQWDRTLMWLVESGNKNKEDIINSENWGNYRNSEFEYVINGSNATKNSGKATSVPTGSTEYTNSNNIYDLAGNEWEWTMEASSTLGRVTRGGNYGVDYWASYRFFYVSSNKYSNMRMPRNVVYKIILKEEAKINSFLFLYTH